MINDSAIDAQLTKITDGDRLYLCTGEPSTYLEAIDLSVGYKDNPQYSIADYYAGRSLTIAEITDGIVTNGGVASHVVIVSTTLSSIILSIAMSGYLDLTLYSAFCLSEFYARVQSSSYEEVFLEVDRPDFNLFTVSGVTNQGQLALPWNYSKDYNSSRTYPLLIYVGGTEIAGTDIDDLFSTTPSGFAYDGGTSEYVVGDYMSEHPAFSYFSHPTELYTEAMALEDVVRINYLIDNYRIDPTRIYIFGYSMGGQAAHYLTDALYSNQGHTIAAINRISGGYKPDILDTETKEWLHNGLADQQYRIDNIRLIYTNAKTEHSSGIETSETETLGPYSVDQYTYTVGGEDFIKLSEYDTMGHTPTIYNYDAVLNWIFTQRRD